MIILLNTSQSLIRACLSHKKVRLELTSWAGALQYGPFLTLGREENLGQPWSPVNM